MRIFKNFLSLGVLAIVALCFTASAAQAQQTREHILLIKIQVDPQAAAAAYIKFDGVDGECQVKEGRNVIGRNTRSGEQIIAIVKSGKLMEIGAQTAGSYKTLTPSASPCTIVSCTTWNVPKRVCLPSGLCFCVCGPWFVSSPTGGN